MLTDTTTARTQRRARQLWVAGCFSLFLALLVLAATGYTVYSNWLNARRDTQVADVNKTYLAALNDILGAVKDAETGQRGYILTGRPHYLEPYRHAQGAIDNALQRLTDVAKMRPDQKPAIDHLQYLIHLKLAELARTLQLRDSEGFNAALEEILTDRGNTAMDEIRAECKALSDAQSAAWIRRSTEAQNDQLNAIRLAVGGGVLLLCFMIAGFAALNSGAAQQAQLAERLADSKEIFETTLNSIGDGVIATDGQGLITFINPVGAALTGWSRQDVLGKHLDEVFHVIHETSHARMESPFEKVMEAGRIQALGDHALLIRKDESEVVIDHSGAPIRNVYGEIGGVVLVFRDNTERRKSEAALEFSHNEVLKANDDLRQFSYAATHDLQEPLRTIVVFSQLLARSHSQQLDERGKHLLHTVEEAAQRMSVLISSLLSYTRVGGPDSSSTQVSADAAEVWDDTLVQLEGSIEETKAQIFRGELPRVWSEPAQLSQVFQNLISNAIKYRKPGVAPVVRVTSRIEGQYAVFAVADNGIGFKQEYSDRIFLLFQRLHGRAIPGTGIGLALCKRIIERQGGRIWVDSQENVGSTFYFTLPVVSEKSASNVDS